ncbi:hypothetical protein [Hyphomicrobium sp.]|uniref:hypothetical protein n=1 Tax=Hyphomicrobium sp. TaxID=82 RepID=UPI002FE3F7D4
MFRIMKVETSDTQSTLDPSNYQPHILYLSKIDADYWWNVTRGNALGFSTLREATATVADYRKRSDDRYSRVQIIKD